MNDGYAVVPERSGVDRLKEILTLVMAIRENLRMERADFLVAKVVRLPHSEGLPLPRYQTEGAAGMDLQAAIPAEEVITLEPGDRRLIPCGFKMTVPSGYEAQVRARSGNALKVGLGMANGVGTIDSDYTGEVGVIAINHGREKIGIRRGDRIGQLIVAPVAQVVWEECSGLDATPRGTGGFGSTGG